MKTRLFITLLICTTSYQVFGQLDFSPAPVGNNTYCPGTGHPFEASGTNGCANLTWSVTNGKIWINDIEQEGTSVTGNILTIEVKWNDVHSIGKLKLIENCTKESGGASVEKSYPIRSLKGRTPTNARASSQLPYCSQTSIALFVDKMYMDNLPPGVEVDGYRWEIPSGWNNGGEIYETVSESMTITPDNYCSGGVAKVKAYLEGCTGGKQYSEAALINLDRIAIPSNLTIPSGYDGPKCGDTDPVTFTAADLSCATLYTWTSEGTGWHTLNADGSKDYGPWNTASNSLKLYPSGTNADNGAIAVNIDLGCTTITQSYTAIYTDPPLDTPIFSSIPKELCSGGSATVSINSVPDAATYTWYSESGGIFKINGQSYDLNTPLITTSTSITISVPTLNSSYNNKLYVTANRSATHCQGSITNFRNIWAGKPADVLNPEDLEGPDCIKRGTFDEFLGIPWPVVVPGANEYVPSIVFGGTPSGITFYSDLNRVRVEVHVETNASLGTYSMMVTPTNSCGVGSSAYATFTTTDDIFCSGGGMLMSVSPNPATSELDVELNGEDNKNDYQLIIVDQSGNLKKQKNTRMKKNKINVNELKEGLYFLIVKSNGQTEYRQILVKR